MRPTSPAPQACEARHVLRGRVLFVRSFHLPGRALSCLACQRGQENRRGCRARTPGSMPSPFSPALNHSAVIVQASVLYVRSPPGSFLRPGPGPCQERSLRRGAGTDGASCRNSCAVLASKRHGFRMQGHPVSVPESHWVLRSTSPRRDTCLSRSLPPSLVPASLHFMGPSVCTHTSPQTRASIGSPHASERVNTRPGSWSAGGTRSSASPVRAAVGRTRPACGLGPPARPSSSHCRCCLTSGTSILEPRAPCPD